MPKSRGGKNNSPRGGRRGGNRGRGGRGRGSNGGRGGYMDRGRGVGRGGGYIPMEMIDLDIQQWSKDSPSGSNTPRGRGRGGNGFASPRSGFHTPRRGFDSPRGQGRGRGAKNLSSKLRAGAPLTKVLNEDRPLLRPISFVRSEHTAILFQEEEDILKPIVEDVADNEESHVPTADRVSQIFKNDFNQFQDTPEEAREQTEVLEEIDFSEIGRLQAEVDATAAARRQNPGSTTPDISMVEEKFTGFYIDTTPAPIERSSRISYGPVLGESMDDDEEIIVYDAPEPRVGPLTPPVEDTPLLSHSILTGRKISDNQAQQERTRIEGPITDLPSPAPVHPVDESLPEAAELIKTDPPISLAVPPSNEGAGLGLVPQSTSQEFIDNESTPELLWQSESTEAVVVSEAQPSDTFSTTPAVQEEAGPSDVLEAVNDRPSLSNVPSTPSFNDVSFALLKQQKTIVRKVHPVRTPRSLLRPTPRSRRRKKGGFASFGLAREEAHLHEGREVDPRRAEQRRGDSDVDWGDEDSDDENVAKIDGKGTDNHEVDEISNGIGGMDLDEDLDVEAMKSFVKSMSPEGQTHVTADDLADEERMLIEDFERDEERSGSSEEDEVGDEDESTDEDENEEDTPRRGFQARLEQMRSKVKGKERAEAKDVDESEEDGDVEMSLDRTWADDDEDYIQQIQEFVDENNDIFTMKDRKKRNQLFHAIMDGNIEIDDYEEMMGKPAKRKKDKHIPSELQDQWDKDRAKKAENKEKRRLARLEVAADPLTPKKGGKKALKAAIAVSRLDSDIQIPNRIVDFVTLEQQIRRFLEDLGGRNSMVTPPADKATRKKVHELAECFNLKTKSHGKEGNRYTMLYKTTLSGININEKKVRRIMRSFTSTWQGPPVSNDRQRGKPQSLAKHREGEVVGHAAPKIGETNIGFKMLAAMGWAEGERIGLTSKGLEAPLTAVMKKTKLGLGAAL
ncbi:Splicing-associated domain-containing protein [Abortiporus biennis]